MIFNYRNPAINRLSRYEQNSQQAATYGGVAAKALYYVLLTIVTAACSFVFAMDFVVASPEAAIIILIATPLIAMIFAFIASFLPLTAPITGSFYALLQGVVIGFISLILEAEYSGVVFAALLSTAGTLLVMLVLYSTGIIRVGSFFRKFLISALFGIIICELLIFLVGLASPAVYELFYGNSTFSILISIGMVLFASLFILSDLQRITEVVESGMDKRYEWSAAFGLLVTLIWLYTEFLRLFIKIASRRK